MAIGKRPHPDKELPTHSKKLKENYAVRTGLYPGCRVLSGRRIIFLTIVANIVVEIGQFISRGTFGKVYRCRDREGNEELALKVPGPGSNRKDAAYNESRMLQWLNLHEPSSTYANSFPEVSCLLESLFA
jgi:serine/threonine protein kinase